jgi:hypothetical protein
MTRRFQSAGASGKSASVEIEVPLRDASRFRRSSATSALMQQWVVLVLETIMEAPGAEPAVAIHEVCGVSCHMEQYQPTANQQQLPFWASRQRTMAVRHCSHLCDTWRAKEPPRLLSRASRRRLHMQLPCAPLRKRLLLGMWERHWPWVFP